MSKRTCTIEGCDRPHVARGWCSHHYSRWDHFGDPLAPGRRPLPPAAPGDPCCTIDGCDKPPPPSKPNAPYCGMHQGRIQRHGSPHVVKVPGPRDPLVTRWHRHVRKGPEWACWEWTGSASPRGYGRFTLNSAEVELHGSRVVLATRIGYTELVGPILDGLELDHLCRNPPCVNPYHLEPVTPEENKRRMLAHRKPATHCYKGHEFSAENTLYAAGVRRCRICANERNRRYREKRRAAA